MGLTCTYILEVEFLIHFRLRACLVPCESKCANPCAVKTEERTKALHEFLNEIMNAILNFCNFLSTLLKTSTSCVRASKLPVTQPPLGSCSTGQLLLLLLLS